MDTILNFFKENPMVTYSILIFIVCLFIGYFGNKYVENQKEIRSMQKIQEKENSGNIEEIKNTSFNTGQSNNEQNIVQNNNIINQNTVPNNSMPSDIDRNLQPFDGVITNDDNINNMF